MKVLHKLIGRLKSFISEPEKNLALLNFGCKNVIWLERYFLHIFEACLSLLYESWLTQIEDDEMIMWGING